MLSQVKRISILYCSFADIYKRIPLHYDAREKIYIALHFNDVIILKTKSQKLCFL